jgi:hypothetical protein
MDEEDIIQQIRDMGWDIIEAAYEHNNLDAAERRLEWLVARVREVLKAAVATPAGTA